MSGDRDWLEKNVLFDAHLSGGPEQMGCVCDALEAGIQIDTFPTLYSPR